MMLPREKRLVRGAASNPSLLHVAEIGFSTCSLFPVHTYHDSKMAFQDLERTSDQQMLAYKEEFKKYKAAQDVRDQNTPTQAFDIYEVMLSTYPAPLPL